MLSTKIADFPRQANIRPALTPGLSNDAMTAHTDNSAQSSHAAFTTGLPPTQQAIPIYRTTPSDLPSVLAQLPAPQALWARTTGFDASPATTLLLPGADHDLGGVLLGVDPAQPLWQLAGLPAVLPSGIYRLASPAPAEHAALLHLGWALGALPTHKSTENQAGHGARLLLSPDEQDAVAPLVDAVRHVRRLVNLPANHLGPAQLASEVRQLAERHGAHYREWVGEALPAAGFALVHAVGQAASQAPRVTELTWGEDHLPLVVIVGKGVCFDSGGLDLKPAAGMRWMKKDMGGAAHGIALAELVMRARLAVRIQLVIPAVENAVGAGALRPGDIITAGNGTEVEIENTDAEGRLILADALHHAIQNAATPPALVIDLATLTGAARMALGPDLPALFSNHDDWANALLRVAQQHADPLWRLPLWAPYRRMLKSDHADTLNAASRPMGGAITAALFLENFVPAQLPWLHLDLFAWNLDARPGRPPGGEAQGLRALFALLSERFPAA
ncbi:MAG: putative cytosol aminopeptidase [Paracidovorax wautersii]|uniref:Putative cytosol aminopeptidase n=1 Tax=Paracidovorax wautersii TaxID=1177982 RepID=A0A7V8FNS8_9BURK|nr:MAG: putative cytosol aminopeptidase [Paracidovorax wautersii]